MQLALDDSGVLTFMGQTVRRDPPSNMASVRDVVRIITGQPNTQLGKTVERLCEAFPEMMSRCHQLRINGKGKETPVADAATLLEIILVCPGKTAKEARRECAEELRRLLRGDPGLVEEIERRHAQMAGTELEAFLKATAPEPGAVLEEGVGAFEPLGEAAAVSTYLGPGKQAWDDEGAAARQARRVEQQVEAFSYIKAVVEGTQGVATEMAALRGELVEMRRKRDRSPARPDLGGERFKLPANASKRVVKGKEHFGQVVQAVADALGVPYTWVRDLTAGPFGEAEDSNSTFRMLTKLAASPRGLDMRPHNPPDAVKQALAAEEARAAEEGRQQALQQRLAGILAKDATTASAAAPASPGGVSPLFEM